MKYHATIESINSKPDVYGNRYWMFIYTDHLTGNTWSASVSGDRSNIEAAVCYPDGDYDRGVLVRHSELPIRAFNRLSKGLPYAGCSPDDIRKAIMENISK